MKHTKLSVEKRGLTGRDLRKLRKEGILPGVVYGTKKESINIQLPKNVFIKAYREVGKTNVIELEIEGENTPTLIHNLDIEPINDDVRHVDFLIVDLKKKITTEVPVSYIGTPRGLSEIEADLNTTTYYLNVEALPDKIPEFIEVNVEGLETLNDSIKVDDIQKSADYMIVNDPEEVLASLVAHKEEVEEEPEVLEGEEGEDGKESLGEDQEDKENETEKEKTEERKS